MKTLSALVASFLTVVSLALLIGLVMAYPTKWAINYLFNPSILVAVFGHSQLTVWNAFWLNFLCGMLFRSISSSGK